MWYVGIYWADEHHVVVVLDEQGPQVATKQVAHTVEGLAQLTTSLALHRRDSRTAGGASMHYRNQPWTAHCCFAGGRLARLPGEFQDRGPPSQTRRSQNGCY